MATSKAKNEFSTGDMVVYPGHGVGKIGSLMSRKIGATEQDFYEIIIQESGMKVMVPLVQAETIGLREIIDKRAVTKVYSIIKDRKVKVVNQTWNRRHREYLQKIKTGSVYEIAEVIRDLLILSHGKDLSFGEKKMMDLAQGLLSDEIALVKARPQDKVLGEIKDMCA